VCNTHAQSSLISVSLVLRRDGNHHDRIFRSLGFVDGGRVTQHQFIQFAKCVGYDVLINGRLELLLFSVSAPCGSCSRSCDLARDVGAFLRIRNIFSPTSSPNVCGQKKAITCGENKVGLIGCLIRFRRGRRSWRRRVVDGLISSGYCPTASAGKENWAYVGTGSFCHFLNGGMRLCGDSGLGWQCVC
jgi:hypothetical protein